MCAALLYVTVRCTEREREMFYLTTHSTDFIYGYMASDIWLRTILIVRKETHCRHIGYSYRITARVLLYAPSHRQDNTYHSLCYTVVEHWLEREIAQWVHPMKDRSDDPSHHERTLYLWATSRSSDVLCQICEMCDCIIEYHCQMYYVRYVKCVTVLLNITVRCPVSDM